MNELGLMSQATSAVVTVGNGRGFVVSWGHNRLVVTAAHCLPRLPPPHGASYLEEWTYEKLLSPLGDKPAVWAECLFADPIADVSVLGSPDNQELFEEAQAYEHWSNLRHRYRLVMLPRKVVHGCYRWAFCFILGAGAGEFSRRVAAVPSDSGTRIGSIAR